MVFKWLGDFSNGYAIAKKDGKLRIVTSEGKDVVIGDWDEILAPSEGFATNRKGGLEGYVEIATGREIKPQWEHVEPFTSGVGLASHENRFSLISPTGEVLGRWLDRPSPSDIGPKEADRYLPMAKSRK